MFVYKISDTTTLNTVSTEVATVNRSADLIGLSILLSTLILLERILVYSIISRANS